jgi:Na+/H+ antiporter NhaC
LKKYFWLLLIFWFAFAGEAAAVENVATFSPTDFKVSVPQVLVSDVSQNIEVKAVGELFGQLEGQTILADFNGEAYELIFEKNLAVISYNFPEDEQLTLSIADFYWEKHITPIPLWMSILPPLIAILIALLLKEVYVALFLGVLSGTTIMFYYQGVGFFVAIFKGSLAVIDTYVLQSLMNSGHMSIIIFSMLIGGVVHLITRNGGMLGVVNRLSRYAKDARSGQFVTWMLGIAIFFDDYANTLVVGNTMRPVTDRLRVSREKLAYIVDSTAAPVAAIAFVTTWIGAELSYIQQGIDTIGLEESAYNIFFNSLAFSYYPFLTLAFVLMLIWQQRDFGPMYKAEKHARTHPDFHRDLESSASTSSLSIGTSRKPRAFNAIIPVLVIVFGTITGLLYTGWDQAVWADERITVMRKISAIIGGADSYAALLWSSTMAMLVAIALTLGQKLLSLKDTIESLVEGFKMMLTAILILTLAWSVALVTEHMHTADFISNGLLELSFSPYLLPALTFILAALVSFSTGSSWGTMAILYPLILPTSWLLTNEYGMDHNGNLLIFYNVVSSVLAGSVLGDHCSPISDTTILSSLASSCNHIDHVRTQLPYAMVVGLTSIVIGTIPAALGVSAYLLFPLALVLLYLQIRLFGKKLPAPIKV